MSYLEPYLLLECIVFHIWIQFSKLLRLTLLLTGTYLHFLIFLVQL